MCIMAHRLLGLWFVQSELGMDLIGGMAWEAEGKVFDGGLVEVLHFGEDGVMLVMIDNLLELEGITKAGHVKPVEIVSY